MPCKIDRDKPPFQYRVFSIHENAIGLPNGMRLAYQDLQILGSQYKYSFRGKPEFTWGGKITENIVQALSRIVITDGLLRIHAYLQDLGGAVVLTVHDEIVCIAPETDATTVMDKIIELMCIPPSWAPDLPLAAEGGFDKAYSK